MKTTDNKETANKMLKMVPKNKKDNNLLHNMIEEGRFSTYKEINGWVQELFIYA